MKSVLLFNYSDDVTLIEKEERDKFVRAVLESVGIPINDYWKANAILSAEDKIKLRAYTNKEDIFIYERGDSSLEIYVKKDCIAKWNPCSFKLKRDLNQIDPKKRLYVEMTMDFWTIFDE